MGWGFDTRSIVRHVRTAGAVPGILVTDGTAPEDVKERAAKAQGTDGLDLAREFAARANVEEGRILRLDDREHRLPHQGKLKLDKFLRHLATDGYQGQISVETSPEAMETEDEGKVRENLTVSLSFCREHYQR